MSINIIDRTKRNHALEHATINVLSEHHKGFSAQGNSFPAGFDLNIYGNIDEADVRQAVDEARQRLQNGEEGLAVHPNCGTVLLTTASIAVLATQGAFAIEKQRQKRSRMDLPFMVGALPVAVLAVTLSLIVSRPLGISLQANYTVDGKIGDMQVTRVSAVEPSIITKIFQMLLGQSKNKNIQSYRVETQG